MRRERKRQSVSWTINSRGYLASAGEEREVIAPELQSRILWTRRPDRKPTNLTQEVGAAWAERSVCFHQWGPSPREFLTRPDVLAAVEQQIRPFILHRGELEARGDVLPHVHR